MKKWSFILLTIATLVVGYLVFNQFFKPSSSDSQVFITPTSPDPIPNPTPQPKSKFSAWVASWDQEKTPQYLALTNNQLSTVSPLWYQLSDQGQIVEIPKLAGKPDTLLAASSAGILVTPTIINDFDGNKVTKFLTANRTSNKQIDRLVNIALQNGYAGWDIDWEQIKASDRKHFSDFVKRFSQQLHAKNLTLSISVHAKTGTNDWEGAQGHDYEALGQSADFIRIMAYDFHYENSPPGPVTPLDKLTQVIKYAKSTIPHQKIVIGLPTYGYDWGPKGKGLQYYEIIARLDQLSASSYRDATSGALRSDYVKDNVKHQVWYEDYQSMLSKVALANSLGVTQFCFWRLGGEDIQFWQNIN